MATKAELEKSKKVMIGEVISDKMDKTVVVVTDRTFQEPRLHKVMRTSKKYKVHDEEGRAKEGDIVEFYEGRPRSKDKYMYLSRIIKSKSKE
jgi:small subunit ribosomal protein S17